MKYPELFRSFSIGSITIKNRVVMAPVFTSYGTKDSKVSEEMIEFYKRRAEGDVGLVVVEAMAVHPSGHGMPTQALLSGDDVMPGLSRLAEEIKNSGAVVAAQIHHTGKFIPDGSGLAPSATPFQFGGAEVTPRQMTKGDMKEIRKAFAAGAKRIKDAGFDMVEIHGGAGYLLASFLSPHSNHRQDEYGGSPENMARYPLEVVAAIKDSVGPDYPVGWRMLVDELLPDGITIEDNLKYAPMLEEAGIAYLSPVAGTYESFFLDDNPKLLAKPGYGIHYTEALKERVGIPVFANGRIIDPNLAEEILKNNKADAVALGRPLVADPDFVKKAYSGNASEILSCQACHKCMIQIMGGKGIKCKMWKGGE